MEITSSDLVGHFPHLSAHLARRSPLFIHGTGWVVDFQEKPDCKVVASGKKPTKEEFRDALISMPFPLAAIDALYVAAIAAWE